MPYVPASEKQAAALRGTNTELAAKLTRATQVHTASAPVSAVVAPAPKPRDTAPKAVAPTLASDPPAQQTARTEVPRAREPETPASNNGLLVGAQPVVPAGSFSSFR